MNTSVFQFPLPPTLNDQINSARTHWTKSAQMKKKWTKAIASQCSGSIAFPGDVWLSFHWTVTRFSRDPDNIMASAKFLMDGLKEGGVIKNDSLMVIQSPQLHSFSRGEDGVTIKIADSIKLIFEEVDLLH